MQITVNKKIYDFKEDCTVRYVLDKFEVSAANGIAVALNYSVVPKSEFSTTLLKSGDVLEIIHATSGG